ncbi:MAG: outer membrane beta-barrel protein, partial [Candidatus Rokubacteria bacterium]|nr:outer membrane beta-barrel protein [Candidatus Rokubacteria bacterium]
MKRAVLVLLLILIAATPAAAYDPDRVWAKGAIMGSFEGGYGHQFNLENKRTFSDIEFLEIATRWSILPMGQTDKGGVFHGALETGLEPIFLVYTNPKNAYYGGLALHAKYHFLSLGRFVPYAELGAGAGGTNLKVTEIKSEFSFLLLGGGGVGYFVTDNIMLYGGYRWTHNSNGNTARPNRGWEANTAI